MYIFSWLVSLSSKYSSTLLCFVFGTLSPSTSITWIVKWTW